MFNKSGDRCRRGRQPNSSAQATIILALWRAAPHWPARSGDGCHRFRARGPRARSQTLQRHGKGRAARRVASPNEAECLISRSCDQPLPVGVPLALTATEATGRQPLDGQGPLDRVACDLAFTRYVTRPPGVTGGVAAWVARCQCWKLVRARALRNPPMAASSAALSGRRCTRWRGNRPRPSTRIDLRGRRAPGPSGGPRGRPGPAPSPSSSPACPATRTRSKSRRGCGRGRGQGRRRLRRRRGRTGVGAVQRTGHQGAGRGAEGLPGGLVGSAAPLV